MQPPAELQFCFLTASDPIGCGAYEGKQVGTYRHRRLRAGGKAPPRYAGVFRVQGGTNQHDAISCFAVGILRNHGQQRGSRRDLYRPQFAGTFRPRVCQKGDGQHSRGLLRRAP